MNVKCPKKTYRRVHLGCLFKFFQQYRRQLITYTIEKRPANAPSSIWWVITYSITPAIDIVNVTFVVLKDKSLLLTQQEQHIQMLINTIMTMFGIEMIEELKGDDNKRASNYVNSEQWHINVNSIVAHIEDQRSFPRNCYEELDVANQKLIIKQVGMFAMELVTGLYNVKAERDDANKPLDSNVPPVLHVPLVKLRIDMFIRAVLDPFHAHISKFWLVEKIDLIEGEYCDLLKVYNSYSILKATINKQDHHASFNPRWDILLTSWFDSLHAFVGGLATVFANTTSIKSNFSIVKWEMDENRTSLMHLSIGRYLPN